MRYTKLFTYTVVLVACVGVHKAAAVHPVESYMATLRQTLADCSVRYSISYTYPDSSTLFVKGTMATQQGKYFDSSDARFVLLNDSWMLSADHRQKVISFAHLPGLRKKLGADLSFSSYLYGESAFLDNIDVRIDKEHGDTIQVEILFKNSKNSRMQLQLLKKNLQLVSYTIRMDLPLDRPDFFDLGNGPATAYIEMSGSHIISPAPSSLFDHRRIISESPGTATLRRFNDYKVFSAKAQKN
jgi:hypothetical protein